MNLESNLLLTGILAALSLVVCSYYLWQDQRARVALACLLLFGGLFGVGVFRVLTSTPGGIDVIDEDESDELLPPIAADDDLESLKDSWDSEAAANWPVASLMSKLSDIAYRPPVNGPAIRRSCRSRWPSTWSYWTGPVVSFGRTRWATSPVTSRRSFDALRWTIAVGATWCRSLAGSANVSLHTNSTSDW